MPADQAAPDATDLLQRILQAAAAHPTRPALSGRRGRTLRYRDLAIAVVATAKGLRHNGFRPGERLLFSVRPDPAGVVLALATVAAGGSVVLDDPASPPEALARTAALTGPAWAAAESRLYAVRLPLRNSGRRDLLADYARLGVRTVRAGPWRPGVPRGTLSLRGLRTSLTDDEPLPGLHGDLSAESVIVFAPATAAATDRRAVIHTRGSLGAAMSMLVTHTDLTERATVCTDHFMIGLPALAAGAHWRLPGGAAPLVDPVRFAKGLERATHTYLGPAALAAVISAIGDRLAPRPPVLREVLVAAPVSAPLIAQAAAVLPGVRLLMVYGTTEILPIAIADGARAVAREPDGELVGELVPGILARTTADGELVVTGPNLARGYLDEPPLTEYATGDAALLRGRSVALLGRVGDVITRGDVQIHPASYEAAVEDLPGVGHAAVVGVPDDRGGERVILALQAAGQPVNEHPLAGEPKESNSRDDEPAAAQQTSVLLQHPLAGIVAAALPSVLEAAGLPDQIVVLSAIPVVDPVVAGGRRVDRTALRRLLSQVPAEDTQVVGNSPATGRKRSALDRIRGRRAPIGEATGR